MITFLKQYNCRDELKKVSLKATPTRIAVMLFLEKSDQPVDVKMILDYLKQKEISVDPATVFRMMNDFLQKEIIKEIQFEKGKNRYELVSKGDHHHLVCENCGKIEAVADNFVPPNGKATS